MRFYYLLIFLFVLIWDESKAQVDGNQIDFVYLDTLPQYPGGEKALKYDLREHINYPIEAYNENLTGKVECEFVIDTLGNITRLKLVKGIRADLDTEALRVVQSLSKWTPAVHDGKKVAVSKRLEIEFRINRQTRKKMKNL